MNHPSDSILYTNFLGPRAENQAALQNAVTRILEWHAAWRKKHFPDDPSVYPADFTYEFSHALDGFLRRLEEQPPYFSPRYAAQMLKDPVLSSLIGYLAVILTNPNNHAYEGGPVTTQMELETVEDLMRLCGFKKGWGHLCSGGSLANMEAIWAVRELYLQKHRKPAQVLFSKMAHYSCKRICSILMIPDYQEIDTDKHFRMDLDQLESVLKKKPSMMVIANAGTTGCGAVDDIGGIVALRKKYDFHLHIDAAYGGYTRSILLNTDSEILPYDKVRSVLKKETYQSLIAIQNADSVTIDPHKQGGLGYGCGAVIYKNEKLKQTILHTAPYTYHIKDRPNIGMFTLEGSRPGAVAAGCWLTHRLIPLNENGYGKIIGECLQTAQEFSRRLEKETGLLPLNDPDLDIFCFYKKPENASLRTVNRINETLYEKYSVQNPEAEFILSKFVLDQHTVRTAMPGLKMNDRFGTSIRVVFMKHWLRMGKPSFLDRLLDSLKKNSCFS